MITAEKIIELYDMKPLLPEGGYIQLGHFSDIILPKEILPSRYTTDKRISGSILYLITEDSFSRMHFLPTDEIYHFYLGDGVEQLQLWEDGSGHIIKMGHDIFNGELLQSVAPANCWHGTRLTHGGKFALLGTTMSPAFTDDDYIDGVRQDLIKRYPDFADEIIKLT
jgi:predicted cupin superfamily sugar epimerase